VSEITGWLRAVIVGVMAGVTSLAILTSTSGDLEPLVAWDMPAALQIPALICVGVLVGLAVTNFTQGAVAYGLNCLTSSTLHVVLYALPGLDVANYTVSRFNNGFTTSFFILMFVGVFGLIGQGIALGVNVYGREILDD
jgi:hypothetical protein